MNISNRLTLQRLIGKIDNDFNISESDWIPRVAAWTIDALSQIKVLPKELKKRKLEVSDRIAQFPCALNADEIKVYDQRGCEIPPFRRDNINCNCNSDKHFSNNHDTTKEIAFFDDEDNTGINFMRVVPIVPKERYFILDGNNIELSFDCDIIIVETLEVATYFDDYYDVDVPYIYDDGLLLEALSWYVLFKYLSRGSKHPVYNLTSNSPVTNPWIQWNNLKYKAANSVRKKLNADNTGWNNFFYNSTFLPRE